MRTRDEVKIYIISRKEKNIVKFVRKATAHGHNTTSKFQKKIKHVVYTIGLSSNDITIVIIQLFDGLEYKI